MRSRPTEAVDKGIREIELDGCGEGERVRQVVVAGQHRNFGYEARKALPNPEYHDR